MIKDVKFEPADSDTALNEKIDQAYKEKYGDSPYLPPMISRHAKEATVRIISE